MPIFADISSLLPFIAVIVLAGIVAGFLSGLFGIGGGAILVPVYFQMLGALGIDDSVRMHVALGTSLAVIIPTSIRSFSGHYKKGAVDTDLIRTFLYVVPMGVLMASAVVAYISGISLRVIFVVFSVLMALKMILGRDDWQLADDIPKGWPTLMSGWFIGFFSTFMGIGGGVFITTFMTLFGRPIHQAVATASGVGVLISIPAIFGFIWAGLDADLLPPLSLGYVNLLMAALTIPMTLLVAPFGVTIAHQMPRRTLEVVFAIYLFLVAGKFVFSLL